LYAEKNNSGIGVFSDLFNGIYPYGLISYLFSEQPVFNTIIGVIDTWEYLTEEVTFYDLALFSSLSPVKPKLRRLTKAEQEQFTLSEDLKAILVGSLLGDLCAEKLAVNARLKFKQSTKHESYLLHLYNLFRVRIRGGLGNIIALKVQNWITQH
jgi:hypothetical protein